MLTRRVTKVMVHIKFHLQAPGLEDGSRIFFVTGRSRSGTTWMARLLNTHPSLFCDHTEKHAFRHDLKFGYQGSWPRTISNQAKDILESRTRRILKKGLIAELVGVCNKFSAQKLGDKSPQQDVLRILEEFPNTKVIIMLRDFRDVCVSNAFLEHGFSGTWKGWFTGPELKALDNEFLREHAKRYETLRDFEKYSRLSSESPDRVIMVRYEDMIHECKGALKRVFAFLGVRDRDSIIEKCLRLNTFERMTNGRLPGQEEPTSFFRKGIIGDWRNYFSAENTATFKEIAGDTLIAAGYEKDNQWGT